MNDKDIYQLFKDAYEFEHQRKDALNARLSLIFTALVVIIGAVTYFINNINFIINKFWEDVYFNLVYHSVLCL